MTGISPYGVYAAACLAPLPAACLGRVRSTDLPSCEALLYPDGLRAHGGVGNEQNSFLLGMAPDLGKGQGLFSAHSSTGNSCVT